MNDHLQFYPTPPTLVARMWSLFKNREPSRVLDPSAGAGDLLRGAPNRQHRRCQLDAIEIDPSRHPVLREHGINVVGLDFMEFSTGALYSHIIMNPPFAQGAQHVLKAWESLFDGEIVALINAQSLRNPCSKERTLLAQLVASHGSVTYITDAFVGPDVVRQAQVEVALIHLVKRADTSTIIGDVLEQLKVDRRHNRLEEDMRERAELTLPNGFVEDLVLTFEAAVRTMHEAVKAEACASYYAARLGSTLTELDESNRAENQHSASTAAQVRTALSERYDDLKERAWSHILRSTQVTSRLSSKAQKRLESEFEAIKKLEISASNIYGFLAGLSSSASEIQIDMACDVFDLVTRYHSDNAVFYMGWKSNDRHRTCGKRIKMTRFVIPGHATDSWANGLRYESVKMLEDMDKVFAMLDGKQRPNFGLAGLFHQRECFNRLRQGQRLTSDYFDVRYYPGVGTIHFFPRNKQLVDRLNRVVGRRRAWLPPETQPVAEGFWQQYEQAERMDAEVRREFARIAQASDANPYRRPCLDDAASENAERNAPALELLFQAAETVARRRGLDVEGMLSARAANTPLLAAA